MTSGELIKFGASMSANTTPRVLRTCALFNQKSNALTPCPKCFKLLYIDDCRWHNDIQLFSTSYDATAAASGKLSIRTSAVLAKYKRAKDIDESTLNKLTYTHTQTIGDINPTAITQSHVTTARGRTWRKQSMPLSTRCRLMCLSRPGPTRSNQSS